MNNNQYQQDLQTIANYLNQNKERFMGGKWNRFIMDAQIRIWADNSKAPLDKLAEEPPSEFKWAYYYLDSLTFLKELAQMIYGDDNKPINKKFNDIGLLNDREENLQEWVLIDEESRATQIAEAIRSAEK